MTTHSEHAAHARIATPCTAAHITFGDHCLNCGFNYNVDVVRTCGAAGHEIDPKVQAHPVRSEQTCEDLATRLLANWNYKEIYAYAFEHLVQSLLNGTEEDFKDEWLNAHCPDGREAV
jgi:hypothetical protein